MTCMRCNAPLGKTRIGVVVMQDGGGDPGKNGICPKCSDHIANLRQGIVYFPGEDVPLDATAIPVCTIKSDEDEAEEAEVEEEIALPNGEPTEPEVAAPALDLPAPVVPTPRLPPMPKDAQYESVGDVADAAADFHTRLPIGNKTKTDDGRLLYACVVAVVARYLCGATAVDPATMGVVRKRNQDGSLGRYFHGFCANCAAKAKAEGAIFAQGNMLDALFGRTPQAASDPEPQAPKPSNVILFPHGGREGRRISKVMDEPPERKPVTRTCDVSGITGDPYAREDAFRALEASNLRVKKDRDAARAASGDWQFELLRAHADPETVRDDALRGNTNAKKQAKAAAAACPLHGEEAEAIFGYRKNLFTFIAENFPDEMPKGKRKQSEAVGRYTCAACQKTVNQLFEYGGRPDFCGRCVKRMKNAATRATRKERRDKRSEKDYDRREEMQSTKGQSDGGKGAKKANGG